MCVTRANTANIANKEKKTCTENYMGNSIQLNDLPVLLACFQSLVFSVFFLFFSFLVFFSFFLQFRSASFSFHAKFSIILTHTHTHRAQHPTILQSNEEPKAKVGALQTTNIIFDFDCMIIKCMHHYLQFASALCLNLPIRIRRCLTINIMNNDNSKQ